MTKKPYKAVIGWLNKLKPWQLVLIRVLVLVILVSAVLGDVGLAKLTKDKPSSVQTKTSLHKSTKATTNPTPAVAPSSKPTTAQSSTSATSSASKPATTTSSCNNSAAAYLSTNLISEEQQEEAAYASLPLLPSSESQLQSDNSTIQQINTSLQYDYSEYTGQLNILNCPVALSAPTTYSLQTDPGNLPP